jgi:uncharacterized protein YbjT (DUF2867 family)
VVVTVLGASGRTGRAVMRLLVARGFSVRAGVRNDRRRATLSGVPTVIADLARDPAELVGVFSGSDTVINCAAANTLDPAALTLIDRDGAIGAIHAAERAGVRRYLQVSAMFANAPDQGDPSARPTLYAKQISDTVLRRSSLHWTIIRPATLTNAPGTGRIAAAHSLPAGHIPRPDVAGVILGCLLEPHTENRAFDITTGPHPIPLALRTL